MTGEEQGHEYSSKDTRMKERLNRLNNVEKNNGDEFICSR